MRAFQTALRIRAFSRYSSTTSSFHLTSPIYRSSIHATRYVCTNSSGSDRGGPPKVPPSNEGFLARLLISPEGEQNRLLAALGYYSKESRAIGAGNTLYKQALARASAAAIIEAGVDNADEFGPQFEMLSVHVYLTLRRLRAEKGSPYESEVKTVMQCIFDVFWTDVRTRMMIEERGMKLIESGKWVKECEQRFFGMALSFDEGWENNDKLRKAIRRNVTCLKSEDRRVEQFHRYMAREKARLEKKTVEQICQGMCWDDQYVTAHSV